MNKRRIMLTFIGMVVGFRLQAKAWSGDDAVCTKQAVVLIYSMLASMAHLAGPVRSTSQLLRIEGYALPSLRASQTCLSAARKRRRRDGLFALPMP